MTQVLVLNQDYSPLAICSVQRAFILVFLKKAELIKVKQGKSIRSISDSFPFPSVIKIQRYIHRPYKGVVLTRHNIFKRDSFQCQYCGVNQDLTLDHLVPKSKGGKSNWTNLVTACKRCNAKKGDYSPEEAGLKLSRIPIKPSYTLFLRKSVKETNEDWLEFLDPKSKAV